MAEMLSEDTGEKKILRRAPGVPVKISDLRADMGRVRIVGTIVSRKDDIGSLIIDDGQSSVLILLPEMQQLEKLKDVKTVLVIGRVFGSEGEIEIQAETTSSFKIDLDIGLYNKVMFR